MIFFIVRNGFYVVYSLTYFTVSSIVNLILYVRRMNRIKMIENKIDEHEKRLYDLQFLIEEKNGENHGYEIIEYTEPEKKSCQNV